MNQYKRCSKCEQTKPVNLFNKNKNRPDGLSHHCKDCRAEYRASTKGLSQKCLAEWRANNRERNYQHQMLDRLRRYKHEFEYKEVSLDFIKALMESECANCGSKEDMTIDHIVELCYGGTHEESNLQALCRSCNIKKYHRNKSKIPTAE